MKNARSFVAASLSAALLAACGGPGALISQSQPSSKLPSQRQAAQIAPGKSGGPTLYVLNQESGPQVAATIYSGGGASLLRSINVGTFSGAYQVGFAVDASGRLYASAAQQRDAVLTIYANRGAKIVRTLHQTHPFSVLTLDENGNLYTFCSAARVCEYANAKQRIMRRLPEANPPLAVDAAGDLALFSEQGGVRVFAPGQTQPYWQITSGVNMSLDALAFDSTGNLYAADGGVNEGDSGSIAVYAPGNSSPIRTITDGIVHPRALAADGAGNLYVLNVGGAASNSVTVYASGGSHPIRTMTDGIVGSEGLPGAGSPMALDASGDLYVANGAVAQKNAGSVTVYSPGGTSPIRTVTQGVQNPVAVGIGP